MWVPKAVAAWFEISKQSVDALREELAAVKAERDILQRQLDVTQVNFDWLRMQTNNLQLERTALMEKAYGIKLPAPEIVRQPIASSDASIQEFSFNDMGDQLARQFGLPLHDVKQ